MAGTDDLLLNLFFRNEREDSHEHLQALRPAVAGVAPLL